MIRGSYDNIGITLAVIRFFLNNTAPKPNSNNVANSSTGVGKDECSNKRPIKKCK